MLIHSMKVQKICFSPLMLYCPFPNVINTLNVALSKVCIRPAGTLINGYFLPQIEQLQTSLQAANDQRIQLENELQHNSELVSWPSLNSGFILLSLDFPVIISYESLCSM